MKRFIALILFVGVYLLLAPAAPASAASETLECNLQQWLIEADVKGDFFVAIENDCDEPVAVVFFNKKGETPLFVVVTDEILSATVTLKAGEAIGIEAGGGPGDFLATVAPPPLELTKQLECGIQEWLHTATKAGQYFVTIENGCIGNVNVILINKKGKETTLLSVDDEPLSTPVGSILVKLKKDEMLRIDASGTAAQPGDYVVTVEPR